MVSLYLKYTMDQLCLPMDLEEDIPQNHLVRIVHAAVTQLDDKIFASAYPGGGRDITELKDKTSIYQGFVLMIYELG
jgi:transposase